MAFIPVGASRVPFALDALLTQSNILVRQQAVTQASQQLSTGLRVNIPSDDPAAAVQGTILQSLQEQNQQFLKNINLGASALSQTESALNVFRDALQSAKSIGLNNNTTLRTDAERQTDKSQVDSLIDSLLNAGNQKYLGRYMFAGQKITQTPFVRDSGATSSAVTASTRLVDLNNGSGAAPGQISISLGGGPAVNVNLVGARTVQDVLTAIDSAVGAPGTATISANGDRLLINGASPVVVSEVGGGRTAADLGILGSSSAPTLTGGTLNPKVVYQTILFTGDNGSLESLNGQDTTFDLNVTPNNSIGTESDAGRSGDLNPGVVDATRLAELNRGRGVGKGSIAIAIGANPPVTVDLSRADTILDVRNLINNALGAGTAVINGSNNGLSITGTAPITVTEVAGATTARDLGILGASASNPLVGSDVDPLVTRTTLISSLNLSSPLGTLQIDNGPYSASIDLSAGAGVLTVEDLVNKINSAKVGVRAEINDDGTGINVVNVLAGSGYMLTGATAQTLGVATTQFSTSLSTFRDGAGVQTVAGDDVQITARDGTTFTVDLSSAKTIEDVRQAIESATAGHVTVGIDPSGALQLTDVVGGAGNFSVQNINGSTTADDLGIANSGSSNTLIGVNRVQARVQGIFDSLLRLRQGLDAGDLKEIQLGTTQFESDLNRSLSAGGGLGSRLQILDQTATRVTNDITAAKSDASNVLEADLSETITNLLTQQTALQAALSSTGKLLQQSLLDFL